MVFYFKKSFIWLCLICCVSCVDPVEPVFEFREGVVYIEAFIATSEGASSVTISESVEMDDNFKFEFVSGATVLYHNLNTQAIVPVIENELNYRPAPDFVAAEGESWELLVTLPDGRQYKSKPEVITSPVPIRDIRATFNPELDFRENLDAFIPGHLISVDIEDPGDTDNFYFWKFRSFENLEICESCTNQIYRDGKCVENEIKTITREYYTDYLCENACWQIRYNENIKLFSDEFTNGRVLNRLPVADVFLYTKEDIVVELQQFSLSAKAYDYYRILKDIVDNNSGLNAPPPAALVGNMLNPDDPEELVLGRFTASATTTRSVFIDRTDIQQEAIDSRRNLSFEFCALVCPPITCLPGYTGPPCPVIRQIACSETSFQTAVEPQGWIEQEN